MFKVIATAGVVATLGIAAMAYAQVAGSSSAGPRALALASVRPSGEKPTQVTREHRCSFRVRRRSPVSA